MGEVLKEFLVNIGYHVDEDSRSKFILGVEKATEEVAYLGKQAVATALAIQVGVSKMANDFEKLYYSSQRTHSAVLAIQSIEYAAKTVGLTSDQARGSVESLVGSMRNNPGVGALLNNLGIQTRGRQGVEIFDDTIQRLSKMPFYIARQYASLLGIEDGVLLQLINNYKRYADARDDASKRRKEAGLDPKKQAADAVIYNNALRSLMLSLDILSERIYSGFIGPATKVITFLDSATRHFIELDKATNGWAGTLGTIATTALGVYLAKLLLMKTLFRGVAAEAAAAAAATAAVGAGGGAATAATAGVFARARAGLLRGLMGRGGGVMGGALMVMLGMKVDSETGNRGRTWMRKQFGIKDEKEDAPWVANKKTRVIDYFMGKGWSRAQATGITVNLHSESNLNPRAVGDGGRAVGVAQWHPDRQAKFEEWAKKKITDSTLEDQLGFVHHELTAGAEKIAGAMLKKTDTADTAASVVSRFYERPADKEGEAGRRGALAQRWYDADLGGQSSKTVSMTVNPQTTINVTSPDPNVAASKTAEKQVQVNADIVRNLGAVTR